jgi:hypothetical protein
MTLNGINRSAVIPANAGIHFDFSPKSNMDSRVCGIDGVEGLS